MNKAELINRIIKNKGYMSYLEIGVHRMASNFSRIECQKKVGVDINDVGVMAMDSDAFFKQNKDRFDCIFIDGDHSYKQVNKDIKNSLKCLSDGGVILLHDCYPKCKKWCGNVPPEKGPWCGEVYRSFIAYRADPHYYTLCLAVGTGIGVIMKKESQAIKVPKRVTFNYMAKDPSNVLGIVPIEEFIKIF